MIDALKKKKFNKKIKEHSLLFKRTKLQKVIFVIVFIIFCIYALSLIFPFVWVFLMSLKDGLEYDIDIALGRAFALPDKPLFINYVQAFKELSYRNTTFFGMFFNSIWYTAFTTFNGVFASCITGYCLAKYRFKGRGILYGIAIFSLTIPTIGTTAAMFKLVYSMGIYNSPLFAILTTFGGFGFNFLVMYGFFQNVSWSYAEAVFVDGGGHFTVFFKVMLPQARAPITTLCIISGIANWNNYEVPILYLPSFPNIASGLYYVEDILTRGFMPIYYAALIIAVVPVLIIFSAFSDIIMKNFTMGGLKG